MKRPERSTMELGVMKATWLFLSEKVILGSIEKYAAYQCSWTACADLFIYYSDR